MMSGFGNLLWTKKENQRAFFDLLGKELGFCQPSDYYKLQREDVYKYGGGNLLHRVFGDSICKVVLAAARQIQILRLFNKFIQSMRGSHGNLMKL